jgi:hypothetical protein
MKQYLLSICYPAGATEPPPDALARIRADVATLNRDMQAAGAWVFAGGLEPPASATVVRAGDGKTFITDGPFIETKEQIGGICVVAAPDLDAALEWGEKLSRAVGVPVEVRPLRAPHAPA